MAELFKRVCVPVERATVVFEYLAQGLSPARSDARGPSTDGRPCRRATSSAMTRTTAWTMTTVGDDRRNEPACGGGRAHHVEAGVPYRNQGNTSPDRLYSEPRTIDPAVSPSSHPTTGAGRE